MGGRTSVELQDKRRPVSGCSGISCPLSPEARRTSIHPLIIVHLLAVLFFSLEKFSLLFCEVRRTSMSLCHRYSQLKLAELPLKFVHPLTIVHSLAVLLFSVEVRRASAENSDDIATWRFAELHKIAVRTFPRRKKGQRASGQW